MSIEDLLKPRIMSKEKAIEILEQRIQHQYDTQEFECCDWEFTEAMQTAVKYMREDTKKE